MPTKDRDSRAASPMGEQNKDGDAIPLRTAMIDRPSTPLNGRKAKALDAGTLRPVD